MFGNIFSFSLHLFGISSAPSLFLAIYVYLWFRRGDGADNLGALVLRALHVRCSRTLFYCFIFYWKEKIKQQSYSNVWLSYCFLSTNSPQSFLGRCRLKLWNFSLLRIFFYLWRNTLLSQTLPCSVLILSCNSRWGYFGGLLFMCILLICISTFSVAH